MKLVPQKIDTYYEPFVGGGALFFALAARPGTFRRAVLADANPELVLCYQALRRDADAVIDRLRRYRYGEREYYAARELEPERLSPESRAARTIYLNRTGYNGLYRVNREGRFNVPFGRHRRPVICDEVRLRAAAAALKKATIVCRDFEQTVKDAAPGDFVYFDPPYVPLSPTSSFTAYAQRRFGPDEQARLAEVLRRLGAGGVPALLSNSDCASTRELYQGLPTDEIFVRRAINSVATSRGPVAELLVRSSTF